MPKCSSRTLARVLGATRADFVVVHHEAANFSRVTKRHTTNLSVAFHEEQQESTVGTRVAEHSDSARSLA